MCQSLPLDIVTQVRALGTALMQWAQTHADAPLAAHEAGVRQVVQAALPGLLTSVVQAATVDLDPLLADTHRRCPRCDRRVARHSTRTRTLQTRCGPITVARPWYHCAGCHRGFSPADATLAVPARTRLTPALVQWLVELNVLTDQRDTAYLLDLFTGLQVDPDTVRVHTTAVGTAVRTEDAAAIAATARHQASPGPVTPVVGPLVLEVDGVMVRYQDGGWHEVKIGVVGGVTDGELTQASYVAAREDAATFGPRWLTEAARRGALAVVGWEGHPLRPGLAILPQVHVVADGAPWIWHLAADHFGDRTEILDFYHACEHLWAVARTCFGEGTPEATQWVHTTRHALRHQGGDALRPAFTALPTPTQAAVDARRLARGYFATHADRLDYPGLAARGLPIGSGAVESSAKHVVQARLKRAGQRWSDTGAAAMIALRARRASHRPLCATVSLN